MLGRALSFPTDGVAGWKTIAIGGVLLFPPVALFFVPVLVVMGYLVAATDASIRGEPAPAFGAPGALLVDGIKLLVVGTAYAVVPGVVFVVGIVTTVTSLPTESGTAPDVGSVDPVGPILILAAWSLFLVAGYVAPAGMANFAYSGRLGAAFSPGDLVDVVVDSDYVVALLLVFLLNVGVGAVVGILTLLTLGLFSLVVLVAGSFLQFYVLVAAVYLVGRGYARSRDIARDRSPRPAADVADHRVE